MDVKVQITSTLYDNCMLKSQSLENLTKAELWLDIIVLAKF